MDVEYERISIPHLGIIQNTLGSRPQTYENPFPNNPECSNLALMRRFYIRPKESFMAPIRNENRKWQVAEGKALASSMSASITYLCNFLQTLPEILELHVELNDQNEWPRLVLGPFLGLKNVRKFTVSSPKRIDYDDIHRLQVASGSQSHKA